MTSSVSYTSTHLVVCVKERSVLDLFWVFLHSAVLTDVKVSGGVTKPVTRGNGEEKISGHTGIVTWC